MAKLYFHYSTMNAGKSTLLLQASYNYRERGMATVEYALGVVIVIVLIGLIITAINTGTFKELLDQLISAIMGWIQEAFKVNLPIKR